MNSHNQLIIQRDTKVKGKIQDNALTSLLKTISYVITGRFHLVKDHVGEVIINDEQEYAVFRQVVVDRNQGRGREPGAMLIIRFNFASGSPKQNKLLSLIPIPLIAGSPGFRSKTWMLNKANGGFQGIYEWETVQDAENYKKSLAIKLMTKRAAPGSIVFQIIPIEMERIVASDSFPD